MSFLIVHPHLMYSRLEKKETHCIHCVNDAPALDYSLAMFFELEDADKQKLRIAVGKAVGDITSL